MCALEGLTPTGKASPEEFLAAAHGTCFAMALTQALMMAHRKPEIRTSLPFTKATHDTVLAFVGLLLVMTVRLGMAVPWTWGPIALAVAAFVALRLKVDVLWVVLLGAVAALVLVR
ncbi:MAG: hypothetical protein GX630_01035 [Actinobacteria bacterium]|nr:hypothetical protein [Actinomycetota bacterium]